MRLRPFFGEAAAVLSSCNAAAERIHQVHDILRLRRGLLARDRHAGLFLLEHFDYGFLVAIDEL